MTEEDGETKLDQIRSDRINWKKQLEFHLLFLVLLHNNLCHHRRQHQHQHDHIEKMEMMKSEVKSEQKRRKSEMS